MDTCDRVIFKLRFINSLTNKDKQCCNYGCTNLMDCEHLWKPVCRLLQARTIETDPAIREWGRH